MGQEVTHRVVDCAHHRPPEHLRVLVGIELVVQKGEAHLLGHHVREALLQLVTDIVDARAEAHRLDHHQPSHRRTLVARDHERVDSAAHAVAMVLTAGRRADDRMYELAALLREYRAEAVLLGFELLVKG